MIFLGFLLQDRLRITSSRVLLHTPGTILVCCMGSDMTYTFMCLLGEQSDGKWDRKPGWKGWAAELCCALQLLPQHSCRWYYEAVIPPPPDVLSTHCTSHRAPVFMKGNNWPMFHCTSQSSEGCVPWPGRYRALGSWGCCVQQEDCGGCVEKRGLLLRCCLARAHWGALWWVHPPDKFGRDSRCR